ncbi:uncharacterized protein LOC116413291 isoform X3 [Galleria mellonella]|uniref:Uncharacterized protein LOC116413291 isoform X3 n=1 Tax=Galleria mellonella TaxID=7137 RepID=A0A6J3C4Z9_GALME|nr:uncharacterized protein LOC116413291 isoform X3 [Galleria mellonella]
MGGINKQIITLFLLQLAILVTNQNDLPWNKWSWSIPQKPIENFFRRQQNMPVKTPEFECKCPPHEECVVEFKINEYIIEFLNLRRVLKNDEAKIYQKEIKKIQQSTFPAKEIIKDRQRRRRSQDFTEVDCCCPPRTAMMPTFITEQKFDEAVDKFNKKKDPPSTNHARFSNK